MRKILMIGLLAGVLSACSNQEPPLPVEAPKAKNEAQIGVDESTGLPVVDPTQGEPINEPDRIGRLINERFPKMDIISVKSIGDEKAGLFEIQASQFEGRAVYTNRTLDFFLVGGDLYVTNEQNEMVNLAVGARNDHFEEVLKKLPFNEALTYKVGAGQRTLVMFSDPDCPNCAAQEEFFGKNAERANLTLRILPMPLTRLHPEAADKARAILCSSNPTYSWTHWMTSPPAVRANWPKFAKDNLDNTSLTCDYAAMVDKVVELTQEIEFNETPILMFENGMVYKGLLNDIDKLDQAFNLVDESFATNPTAPRVIPPAVDWVKLDELRKQKAEEAKR